MTQSLSNKRWIKPVAIVVALVLVAATVGYSYASPYLVLHRLKAAADARDAATLNEYVDYPALRVSLKEQAGDMLTRHLEEQHGSNPMQLLGSAIGTAIGTALIGSLVDAYATPDGVAALLNGMPPGEQPPSASDGNPAHAPAAANAPDELSAESDTHSTAESDADSDTESASADSEENEPGHPQTTAGYRGFNEFVVTWQRRSNSMPYSAVLQRHGPFSWKLGAVELNEPAQ